jgi:xanthine dehydrogenase molybdopterin-binding subunit B
MVQDGIFFKCFIRLLLPNNSRKTLLILKKNNHAVKNDAGATAIQQTEFKESTFAELPFTEFAFTELAFTEIVQQAFYNRLSLSDYAYYRFPGVEFNKNVF